MRLEEEAKIMKEIRVMILDDEYIILDGLNSFPWEEYGCRVTGLAKNGLEGMEILKEAAPDLILSDVKMPGMDGLAFSERAKEISPEATIVILTGYDSFAYARQAISIGVKEYLLKPVDYDQLKETVGRLCEKIREEKEQKRHVEELQKHFQASLPRLRSEFASNLLHGRVQGRGELKAQEASLDICIEKYVVCIGRKSYGGGRMEEGEQWIEEFGCIPVFEEIFTSFGMFVLSTYDTASMEYAFLLFFEGDKTDEECLPAAVGACEKIQSETKRMQGISMNFGLSGLEHDSYQARTQYRNARQACRQCVYLGENAVVTYQELMIGNEDGFTITTGEKTHFMMTLFQEGFSKAEAELTQIFDGAGSDVAGAKFAAMDLLLSCMKFPYTCYVESGISRRNWNVSALQNGIRKIGECETVEDVVRCLLIIFSTLIKQNSEDADERNMRLVKSILDYIDRHYAEDLSMDVLAGHFYVSRTYISRLLKKYVGKSFLEYLNDVRFRHAEELIECNRYKQYQIAEMVGFKDFGYYIKVFKKRYGITPNEFRKHI